jgi:hypothetical protein
MQEGQKYIDRIMIYKETANDCPNLNQGMQK